MRRRLALWLLLGLAVPVATDARPRATAEVDEIDPVLVAAVLIGDGHPDRALRILDEVDLAAQDEDFDLARYWRLRGLCHFQLGAIADAVRDFQAAIETADDQPEVWLRLAQAQGVLGEHEAALHSLDRAGEAARAVAGGFLLRVRSLVALERYDAAWAALAAGRAAFPDEAAFDREQLFLLIRLQLFQQARVVGARYLEARRDDPVAWLAVGEALRQGGQPGEAAAVLEAARLRFPGERDVHTLLARTYVDLGMPGACGTVLQQATAIDPALAAPAASCFRDAGRLERAMALNARVEDPVTKARQRLDLLVRAEDWTRAGALVPRLRRLALLDEDPVAYAVAYAQFQLGDFAAAESSLQAIDDPQLFADAAALRKAMADCDASGGCR